MSIKVQSLIWEHAPYRGNTLLALLALGDWANDEGSCWPNMTTLAKKSRQSLRSVQYAVEQLVKDDFLIAEINRGAGKTNRFEINTQKLRILAARNTQFTTEKHAKRDIAIRKNRQEPSNTKPTTPLPPFQGVHSRPAVTRRTLDKIQKEMKRIFQSRSGVYGLTTKIVFEEACVGLMVVPDDALLASGWKFDEAKKEPQRAMA